MRIFHGGYSGNIDDRALWWLDDLFDGRFSFLNTFVEPIFQAIETKHSFKWSYKHDIDFEYSSFADPDIIVTGVRSDSHHTDEVVVTGSSTSNGIVSAALYQGSLEGLASASASDWNILEPEFEGQTVTSSTFYGPNTARFDPDIGFGKVRAVGSYKYAEAEGPFGPVFDHGMIYEGPVDGVGGTWTQIDADPLVQPGDRLLNTIAHSNMGDLVVGNYDTRLIEGKAFIYNLEEEEWVDLNPLNTKSVTAYGIWQNGGSDSTSYTIAGGFSKRNSAGLDVGYLVDYDSETHTLSNVDTFQFKNKPLGTLISHFDGITGTEDGYNLTGDFVRRGKEGAFFASVEREADGSFGEADWTEIAFPGKDVTVTSGNTVVDDTVLGIYVEDGAPNSFFASPADPHHGWDFLG